MPNIPSPLRPGPTYFSTLLFGGQYMKTEHGTFRIWWYLYSKQERKECYWNRIGRLVSRSASHEYIRLAHLDETTYTKKDSLFGGINQTPDDLRGKRFNEKILGSLQSVSMKAEPGSNICLYSPNCPKSHHNVTLLLFLVNTQCHGLCHHTSDTGHWMHAPLPWNSDMTAIAATSVATTTKMDSPLSLLLCFASFHLQVWKECVTLLEQYQTGEECDIISVIRHYLDLTR